ncbi:MAG: hypothetical protein PHO70_00485 [Candidatus Omnitrophica bacterium]|nr:hypothetical protein [Candidatus Omnitrophota bacterium]
MNENLEKVQNKFLETLGIMSSSFGLNAFVIKLYGILYLNAKPLSLDEMAQALGASKGNVSLNIRELEKWGAVRRVWVKGSRKDFYEAEANIKKIFLSKLKTSIEKKIFEISNTLEDINKVFLSDFVNLNKEEKIVAEVYRERLKNVEELKEFVANALIMAEKIS